MNYVCWRCGTINESWSYKYIDEKRCRACEAPLDVREIDVREELTTRKSVEVIIRGLTAIEEHKIEDALQRIFHKDAISGEWSYRIRSEKAE